MSNLQDRATGPKPAAGAAALVPYPGNSAPVPTDQRIATLDTVRGFALMGILVMNMPGFGNSFFAGADGSHLWAHPPDRLAEQGRDLLFSGKFSSLFSLLFGIGITGQFAHLQQADPQRATGLYARRLAVLGVIGLLHASLFWTGDVLHVHAVLGLLALFPLRRASDRTLLLLMALCLLCPALNGCLRLLVITPDITAMLVQNPQAFEHSNNTAYGQGSFAQAAAEHLREFAHDDNNRWSLWGMLGWYVQMALTLLLGLLAGRRRWPQRIAELMPQIRRLQGWALVVGLACGAVFTVIFELNRLPGASPIKLLGSVAYWLSRLSMMVFYVLTLVRLAQHPVWAARLGPMAAAGRMPLTNCLMQTALCTTLLYGGGFGLWGQVGPAAGLALALLIFFGVQLPCSFELGPTLDLQGRIQHGLHHPAEAAALHRRAGDLRLAGCASAAKDCTVRLPTSGPPAQTFITLLHSLEQAGLVVQSVHASGRVTMAPNHHCRPPPKQTLDALRSKAVQALTDRDYAESGCGIPPIVITQACLQ